MVELVNGEDRYEEMKKREGEERVVCVTRLRSKVIKLTTIIKKSDHPDSGDMVIIDAPFNL